MVYLQLRRILINFLLFQKEKLEVYGIEKLYIGCYRDNEERALPYGKLDVNNMTNDMCASHCCSFLDDATFSGTEQWRQCFCSNVTHTDNFVRTYSSECNMPCAGHPSDICGGSWRLSVYSIECSSTTTTLPDTRHISTLITDITTETTKPASLESTTDKPQLDLEAAVAYNYSVCSCADCLPSNKTLWTKDEITDRVILLKNKLLINKKETSLYKNTKRSAYDSRKSARNLGIFGIIVMMLPVIFVISIDIISLLTVTQSSN
ncbi:Hypothetical predicted protein [Mytilus galloprovincialis]|uniref:WSC domain-containing protein n=1 Tax=Mytilus galloprovincialis TaxID=29158 RepID=A0A8B6BFW2_MYTGA|nr:Hypothetical predicted protein [Mytilus galloprovincialis]